MKKININGVEYECLSNALTRLHYKKLFGTGIFKDISRLTTIYKARENVEKKLKEEGKTEEEIQNESAAFLVEFMDDIMDIIERFTYVIIYTANPDFESFEKWLSEESMAKIDFESEWIQEVTEYVMDTFRGQGVA